MRSTWSRIDGYVLNGVLALGFALTFTFGLLLPTLGTLGVGTPVDRIRVGLPEAARETVSTPGGSSGRVELVGSDTIELAFADPGAGQRVLLALPIVFGGLLALVVIVLLWRIARTVPTDPFVPPNARRLLMIGSALIAYGLLAPAVGMLVSGTLIDTVGADLDVTPLGTGSSTAIVVGFGVAVLSEVFRQGTRLRADVEGLV